MIETTWIEEAVVSIAAVGLARHETEETQSLRLFADHRAARLHVAGQQAHRLLLRAECRAFQLWRRPRPYTDGARPPARCPQFRLARLRSARRHLAHLRCDGRIEAADVPSAQRFGL